MQKQLLRKIDQEAFSRASQIIHNIHIQLTSEARVEAALYATRELFSGQYGKLAKPSFPGMCDYFAEGLKVMMTLFKSKVVEIIENFGCAANTDWDEYFYGNELELLGHYLCNLFLSAGSIESAHNEACNYLHFSEHKDIFRGTAKRICKKYFASKGENA